MADDVTVCVACDQVIQDSATSKISLIGLFDSLQLGKLPARPATDWYLFLQVVNLRPGERTLGLQVVEGEDDTVIFATDQSVPDDHGPTANFIVSMQPVTFQSEGPHNAKVSLDGSLIATLRFDLRLIGEGEKG